MRYLSLFFIALLINCTAQKIMKTTDFEPYNFEIKGFDWMPNPYQFSSYIQDSTLQKKGNQFAAWQYSYIGDHKNTLVTWDQGTNPRPPLSDSLIREFKGYKAKAAIPYILEKAKHYPITIINEAHQMPQHRVFTTRLLKGLYAQGYRHLGMEGYFSSIKSDSLLEVRGYPLLTHGFYVIEPQFGNLIRTAKQLGFQIFGYESSGHENGKEREINQANNIKAYLAKHPNEKVLIHCGFAHGAKGNYGGQWEKTMTGRLMEFTGINPLTINQTNYSEKSERNLEDAYFQLVGVNEPTILLDYEGKSFGKYREESYFDLYVYHPRTQNFDRPEWLLYDERKMYQPDLSKANIDYPCLVFAYKKGEAIGEAVPYDVQEITEPTVNLVLAPGAYDLVLWNQAGDAVLGEYVAR